MITASNLLKFIPDLPPTSKEILGKLVATGVDPMIHIPGLPALGSIPAVIPQAVKDAVVEVLGRFNFTFYQTLGVRVSMVGSETSIGGVGAQFSETLNVKNPLPSLKVAPVFELGTPKE